MSEGYGLREIAYTMSSFHWIQRSSFRVQMVQCDIMGICFRDDWRVQETTALDDAGSHVEAVHACGVRQCKADIRHRGATVHIATPVTPDTNIRQQK